MRKIDLLLSQYGESHQNGINKKIHWVCVPAIMLSLIGIISLLPFPIDRYGLNWAVIILTFALYYYYKLSPSLFWGFLPISILLFLITQNLNFIFAEQSMWIYMIIFVGAWIGQFYGHHIEGKRPSFLTDLQFLFIGPAWLLHFIYNKLKIKY